MRILLTGHKGFIGSRIYELLRQLKHSVYGIDLTDGKDVNSCSLDYEIDLVIHLAGKSGVRESLRNPSIYWYNNVEASKRLFSHFKDTRIVYASSSSAYEPHLNPYAASKFIIEQAAEPHANALGLRIHTTYSSTPRPGMFFDKLLNKKLEYTTPHYRDFIHLQDVCDAILFLALNTNHKGIIDIGTGTSIYIPSIAPGLNIKEYTPHERQKTQADIRKLKELGFEPKYSVENFLTEQGIDATLQYITGETK